MDVVEVVLLTDSPDVEASVAAALEDLRAVNRLVVLKTQTDASRYLFSPEPRVPGVVLVDSDLSCAVSFMESLRLDEDYRDAAIVCLADERSDAPVICREGWSRPLWDAVVLKPFKSRTIIEIGAALNSLALALVRREKPKPRGETPDELPDPEEDPIRAYE